MKNFKIPKNLIKKFFNALGYDIIRANNNPARTLLGLRNLPIKTIIDIGANEGQFARYICKIFPDAYIYCFEPLPEPFEKLRRWVEKERKSKASIFNFALGDKEGTFKMFLHYEHTPSSSFLKTTEICEKYYPFTKSQTTISVKMTKLDNWIKSVSNLELEILVKLDVQGYEDRVIRGGKEVFKKLKHAF
ncbi:MAG: FkbM family methyltransferase [candidate division WOR-3 bacterium]